MSVERKEVGPRMSQIVIHGDTVYLAGVVAHQNAGKSITEQTREILATIDRYLSEAGTDKAKLLSANIWLTDMATFGEMNAVWDAWVVPGHTPARATVEAKLAGPSTRSRSWWLRRADMQGRDASGFGRPGSERTDKVRT